MTLDKRDKQPKTSGYPLVDIVNELQRANRLKVVELQIVVALSVAHQETRQEMRSAIREANEEVES